MLDKLVELISLKYAAEVGKNRAFVHADTSHRLGGLSKWHDEITVNRDSEG